MSRFDGRRLPASTFDLDVEGLRSGWYSDAYFNNIAQLLGRLAAEGYHYAGEFPRTGLDVPPDFALGDLEVEMQWFARRDPFCVACGVDEALAILAAAAHQPERLEVEAVHDGDLLRPWQPALRVRGRYRDFGILETATLGCLARRSRIATNTREVLHASGGKPILYFPARFDVYQTQAGDGYAYANGVARYNHEAGTDLRPAVSTDAQGQWWGVRGSGTVAHAVIVCFLCDTAEAMLQFARLLPTGTPRVALVDTNNDCITDALRAGRTLYRAWRSEQDPRYVLHGVRVDTGGNMIDACVEPVGDARLDCGVNPRLVTALRAALDAEGDAIEVPAGEREQARSWFREVKIVATGGFDAPRIARFERLGVPVDIYGVGSALIRGQHNDFTADVVGVKLKGQWVGLAKVGRGRVENPDLEPVDLAALTAG